MDYSWISFFRDFDGGSMIVTAAQRIPESVRREFPVLAWIEFPMKPDAPGRVNSRELDRVRKLEDAAARQLGGAHTNIGHMIGADGLVAAFMVRVAPPSQIELKTGLLSRSKFPVEVTGWDSYDQQLAATPLEFAHSHFKSLHQYLRGQGDVGTVSRPVDFTFICPTPEQRASLTDLLLARGFLITSPEDDTQAGTLEAKLETCTEQTRMDELCASLFELCDQVGVTFDGWGTPICQDSN